VFVFVVEGNSARRFIALWQHCLFDCTLNYTSASARLHGLLDTAHVMLECGKERETMEKSQNALKLGAGSTKLTFLVTPFAIYTYVSVRIS
jgi:hypothetical protein